MTLDYLQRTYLTSTISRPTENQSSLIVSMEKIIMQTQTINIHKPLFWIKIMYVLFCMKKEWFVGVVFFLMEHPILFLATGTL